MQKVRNKWHNILFTIQMLTDVMRVCDTTKKVIQRLYLLQLKNANRHGQSPALTAENHYVGGWTPMTRQPNGVSKSRCGFFRLTFRKESYGD